MVLRLLALAAALTVSACAQDSAAPIRPYQLDYSALRPIAFNVAQITYEDNSVNSEPSDMQFAPFQPQPKDAIFGWGKDRLRAEGTQGRIIVNVQNVRVTSTPLKMKTGFESTFKRQTAEKWTMTATAELRAENALPGYTGKTTASATRYTTIPENPTLADRENAWRRLVTGLMDDLNKSLETGIQEHLSRVTTVP